jgi:tRNA-splicing ligase RtcB (3'-phosphate/5'-hydroxy nucleic acid ligase)
MKIERIDKTTLRIPKTGQMKVDGIVYLDGRLWAGMDNDACLEQVANVACLPGILNASYAMPDIHWGYGFPIGGVAAFDLQQGVVSPGGVGYDINCGVRLLRTNLDEGEVVPRIRELTDALFNIIPSGLGSSHRDFRLSPGDMQQVCEQGAGWATKQGYGETGDLPNIEEQGKIAGADYSAVSSLSYERGRDQLGTLGSGNHFVEVGVVEAIYLPHEAEVMGLSQGQVVISVHTGSRGFGYQICSESMDRLQDAPRKYGINLPDRQLVCAPIQSPEGQEYLGAMACAANFAFANRQMITHYLRGGFQRFFHKGPSDLKIGIVYDVAHNIAKLEEHEVRGRNRTVCVHRKGATRALPPKHPLVPEAYREIGQPVLVPGDMGRYSYVLVGAPDSLTKSFGSCAHGAGRVLGRKQALRATKGRRIDEELAHRGVTVRAAGRKTLREEFPEAYKDVAQVVRVVEKAGLARPVARLRPLGVIKG